MTSNRILYFTESENRPCVVRFVKQYKKRNLLFRWFTRPRVEYTLFHSEALLFNNASGIDDTIYEHITQVFTGSKITISNYNDFLDDYANKSYYVISKWHGKSFSEFFDRLDQGGKASYTKSIDDATIFMDKQVAEETLQTIRNSNKDQVAVKEIHLNLINCLLLPTFMITCTRRDNGETSYFKKVDGNSRLRSVSESKSALLLTFRQALDKFEYLRTHHKNFLFAVLPSFADNVNAKDIESYVNQKNLSRSVAMDFKLKKLSRGK